MAIPNIFATKPAGNIPASTLDENFAYLQTGIAAPVFTTLAAQTQTPPAFQTSGYRTAGDGGGASYVAVVSEPAHPGKVQINGQWYEMTDEVCNPAQFAGYGYRYNRNTWTPIGKTASDTAVANCIAYAVATGATMDWTQMFICETAVQLANGKANCFNNFRLDLSRATGVVIASGKSLVYLIGNAPTAIGNLTVDALQGPDGLGTITLSLVDAAKLAVNDWINVISDQSLTSQAANKALNKQSLQVHTINLGTGVIQLRGFLFNDFLLDDTARVEKIDTTTRIEVAGEAIIYGSGGSPAGTTTVFQRAFMGVYCFENNINRWTTIDCERGCWTESNSWRTYVHDVRFFGCSNWRAAAYGVSWSGCQDCGTGKIRTRSGARHAVTSNAGSSTYGSWCSNGLSYGDIEHVAGYAGAMDTHAGVGPVKFGHVKDLFSPDYSTGSSQATFSQGAGYQGQSLEVTGGGSTGAGFQSIGWLVKNFKPSAYIASIRGNGTISSGIACDNLTNHNDSLAAATGAIAATGSSYVSATGVIVLNLTATPDADFIVGSLVNLSALTGTGGFATLNGTSYPVTAVAGTTITVTGPSGAGASTITGGTVNLVTGTYNNGTGVVVLQMTTAPANYKVGATIRLSALAGTGAFASLASTWPVTIINGVFVTVQATAALGASTLTAGDLNRVTTLRTISSGTYDNATGATVLTVNRTSTWLSVGQSVAIDTLTGTGAFASINGTWLITAVVDVPGTYTVTLAVTSGLGASTITGGKFHSPVAAQDCSLDVGSIQGWFDNVITATPSEGNVFIRVSGGEATALTDSSVSAVATAKGRCEVRVSGVRFDHRPSGDNCIAADGANWLGSGLGSEVILRDCAISSLSRNSITSSSGSNYQISFGNVRVTTTGTATYAAAPKFCSNAISTSAAVSTGTWTPSMSCVTNPGDIALSAVSNVVGTYTLIEIGSTRLCHIQFQWTGTPTFTVAAGAILITGLPFGAKGTTGDAPISIRTLTSGFTWPGAPSQVVGHTNSTDSSLRLRALKSATGETDFAMANIVSAAAITFAGSGWYTVT